MQRMPKNGLEFPKTGDFPAGKLGTKSRFLPTAKRVAVGTTKIGKETARPGKNGEVHAFFWQYPFRQKFLVFPEKWEPLL